MGDIAVNLIESREQGGDSAFFDSNIYVPPTNRIVLAINYTVQIAVSPVAAPVVSGNNLTWSLVHHQTFDHAGVDRGSLTIHRGLGAAPTSARTRATYSLSQLRNAMTILEGVNVDISALGVNAVVQTKGLKIADGVTLAPAVTLDDAAAKSNNSVLGLLGFGSLVGGENPTLNNGIGFNIVAQTNTTEGGGNAAEFRGPFQQLTDWTASGGTFAWGVVALELNNADDPPDPAAPQVIGRPAFVTGNLIT